MSLPPDLVTMLAKPPWAPLYSAGNPVVMTSISAMDSMLTFMPNVPLNGSVVLAPSSSVCSSVSRAPLTLGLPSPSTSVTPGASVRTL